MMNDTTSIVYYTKITMYYMKFLEVYLNNSKIIKNSPRSLLRL